ncbi:MAG: universal stress protein [Bacteroidales bacterium]|nr:universal stress protein [Bacteroidales bacterium]
MTANQRPIIVPWDYSEKAEFALQHAIVIAKTINTEIILVHIVKRDSETEAHKQKLAAICQNIKEQNHIEITYRVKAGNIFTEITNVIAETDALIAFMGTHGMKGFQKITGSWALKVIAGSKAPFIVVQDRPQPNADITKIVVPLDFKLEEREKLVWTSFIASLTKCKFFICYTENSDQIIQKRTLGNIKAAISYLESEGINYELHKLPGDNSNAKETIQFAKKIGSGMIIIMTTKNITFQDYVLGADEQLIIANDSKIPVMCVNPSPDIKINKT